MKIVKDEELKNIMIMIMCGMVVMAQILIMIGLCYILKEIILEYIVQVKDVKINLNH